MVVSCHVSNNLWHNMLGHPADQVLNVLKIDLNLTKFTSVSAYEFCHRAKQIRDPFPLSDHKSEKLGELIHLDLWGHYKVTSREGFKYFLTVVGDFSKAVWVYFIKTKDEVFNIFVSCVKMIHNQFDAKVNTVRLPTSVLNVVSKSFAVTTADASDKRQQQQDSTSSTSTLATTMHSVLETSTASAGINQQGTSHEVSVSTDDRGWRWKRIVKDKEVKRREAIHTALAEKGSNAYLSVLTNKMILFDDKSSHGPSECNATTLLSQLRIYLNIDFDFISHGEIYSFYRLYHSEIVDIDKVVFLNGYASSSHMTDVRFKTSHALSTKIITMMKAQSIKEIVCKLSDL
ncbi:ribonuclease H-like domain-containing protein [Tanacetum coccineum]|uniref:Ribonuclease H-like domain-containing protein n=1 Tax=Tanacetum coccineum TaxID=301880 RepID=A0ABQ5A254_9ASTR